MKLFLAALFLTGTIAWTQDVPPAIPQDTGADEPKPAQEYGGPAILSRGRGPTIGTLGDQIKLRPFITLNGVYDSGLGTLALDQNGQVPFSDGYGVESMFGITGTHNWSKSSLDLDYRGALRHYTQRTYFDGMDNSLLLGYQRQINPHWAFGLTENAARYSQAFALPLAGIYNNGTFGYNPALASLGNNDLFDSPTTMVSSGAQVVYQHDARLSFGFGGNGFLVRRRPSALIGADGYTARSDVAYRLTRYQTIAFNYNFNSFRFTHTFGQSDIHGLGINYSIRLGRRWEAALGLGAYRIESQMLNQVQLDPIIAAILGQSFGVEKFHGISYAPQYGVHLTRSFHHASASMGYDRTVGVGNGIYMTVNSNSANAGFSYNGVRRLTLQLGASYTQFAAVAQSIGNYRNYTGGGGFTYQLKKNFSAVGRIDGRRYYIQSGSGFNRIFHRAVFGFAWSPGDYPLALW